MVTLSEIRKSNGALKTRPGPVCVFAGGTSGIGEATLRALAAHTNDPRVFIVGRNEQRANQIIEDCSRLCPGGTFTFLKKDLTLLKNVDDLCKEIKDQAVKLDLLFMSQGYLTLQGRKETSEGIDALMCLRYYSRMRLSYNLLPLLLKADSPRIVSIFAAGKEGRLFPDDLSLRRHFGLFNCISHVCFMTTFFFENLVAQNPTLSCLHVYPGLVKTSEFENGLFPRWLKWFFKWIMLPLITPLCISVAECGERNLFHGTSEKYPAPRTSGVNKSRMKSPGPETIDIAFGIDGQRGSGVYAVNWDGGSIRSCESVYSDWRKKGMRELVWEHTMKAFKAVEDGRVFTD